MTEKHAGVDAAGPADYVGAIWEREIVPQLTEYIRIPNKSPLFDPDWAEHGHMDRAVAQIEAWCRSREIPGLTVEVLRLEGRTPLLYMETARQVELPFNWLNGFLKTGQ